jgi:mRNA interferase MazF
MLRLALASYNGKTGLMVCCPISTKVKGHPFEVVLEIDGVASAVLSDQVSSLGLEDSTCEEKSNRTLRSKGPRDGKNQSV